MNKNTFHLQSPLLKKQYSTPIIKKLGVLKNITLKAGSVGDGTMPRTI